LLIDLIGPHQLHKHQLLIQSEGTAPEVAAAMAEDDPGDGGRGLRDVAVVLWCIQKMRRAGEG